MFTDRNCTQLQKIVPERLPRINQNEFSEIRIRLYCYNTSYLQNILIIIGKQKCGSK